MSPHLYNTLFINNCKGLLNPNIIFNEDFITKLITFNFRFKDLKF